MLLKKSQHLLNKILNAIFPQNCAACGVVLWDDPVPFLCRRCWADVHLISGPVCSRCSRPFVSPVVLEYSPLHQCSVCRLQPPAYSKAWTPYAYQTPLKEAIVLFKYKGKVSLASPLAERLLEGLGTLPPLDLILPVPLHPHRLREREYNQSLLLAHRVSRHFNIPLSYTNLIRIRHTAPQVSLKRRERLKNLRRSFAVQSPSEFAGRTILLIDDVLTTGTTVNECAKALRKAGSGPVYVAALARMV